MYTFILRTGRRRLRRNFLPRREKRASASSKPSPARRLTWPERCESESGRLDLTAMSGLHFMKPDLERMPCLALAMDCARRGGNAPAVMSAANEVAVGLYLLDQVGFYDISDLVKQALDRVPFVKKPDLGQILAADRLAREAVYANLGG